MRGVGVICAGTACLLTALSAGRAEAGDRLYWTNGSDIYYKDLPAGPALLAYHHPGDYREGPMWVKEHEGKLYWSSYEGGKLYCSGPEGQNPVVLIDQVDHAYTRNIEFHGGKIYWASEGVGKIYRADLNGQNVEEVIGTYASYDEGIVDFEIHNGRFYWTSWDSAYVSTCALDGSGYERFHPADARRAFWIEIYGDQMYIGDSDTHTVRRYAMDGQSYQTLITIGNELTGGDVYKDRVYFNVLRIGGPHDISSMDLQGNDYRVEHAGACWQLAATPEPTALGLLAAGALAVLRRRRPRAR